MLHIYVSEGLFWGPINSLVKINFEVKSFCLLFQVEERFYIFFPEPLSLYAVSEYVFSFLKDNCSEDLTELKQSYIIKIKIS